MIIPMVLAILANTLGNSGDNKLYGMDGKENYMEVLVMIPC